MDILEVRRAYPQYEDLSDGDLLMALRNKFYPDIHPRVFFDKIEGSENAHATIRKFRDDWVRDVKKPMTGEDLKSQQLRLGGRADSPTFTTPGRGEAAMRSGLQGMTWGAGDEIVAGATSMLGRDYDTELARERARLNAGRDEYPGTAFASEIGGAVLSPGAGIAGTGSKAVNVLRGAGIGAAEGGVQGFLSGEGSLEDRLSNAMENAMIGGGVGAVLEPLTQALRAGADSTAVAAALRRITRSMPGADADQLQQAAQAAFRAAERDAPLPQSDFNAALGGMRSQPVVQAIDKRLHPHTSTIIDDLDELATAPAHAGGIPYRELQIQRQRLGGLPTTAGGTERSAAAALREGIDDVVETGFASGPAVAQANNMWRRLSRHEDVQRALELASTHASGLEAGLRNEFRKIKRNRKAWGGYNDTERAAINAIIEGTPWGNTLRQVARFGSGRGGQHNVLGATAGAGIGAGIGAAAFGPAGAVLGSTVLPALGTIAEPLAEASTRRSVQVLEDLLLSGGTLPPGVESSALTQFLIDSLRRMGRAPAIADENLGLMENL